MIVPEPRPAPALPSEGKRSRRLARWHRRVLRLCFIVFAFELGVILLLFPWASSWDLNWLPWRFPVLRPIWLNQYFRGAISGLGVLNLYVAVHEVGQWMRNFFARK